ncbi:hypothetical protein FGE12_01520 [Aggregicoccus sp. 17bor-14]|uniref:hypothetical protein n=1 Tax=Myxococcaceae TaxID=31 RepID=UPI00129C2404|nr:MULTISPECIES: hypothetical protein [Myxococcaceae]MBF5041055.1 hypothetical protein [Simulacricoccus sp. 17bor-14]MRI86841.1 hypothetical protein [Aggregicoccus sp. 17bor-14]
MRGRVGTARGRRAGWGAALALAGACLGSLPLAAAAQAAPQGRIFDRVVAVVENQVLTLSELEFEARVALLERGGVQAAEAPLDEAVLRSALELALSQRLQVLDADRLQASPADPQEVQARYVRLVERMGGEPALQAFLARYEADAEGLRALLERSVRAEHILDSRVRLRAQVSEAEVRRSYEAHARELGGAPYASVRAQLRERLVRERYAQLAQEELANVRRSPAVRRVAPFAREAAP